MSTTAHSNDTVTIFMATVRGNPVQINVTRKAGASNWVAGSAGILWVAMSIRGAQHAAQTFSDSICGGTVVEVQLTPVPPPAPPPPTKKEKFRKLLNDFELLVPQGNGRTELARLELDKLVIGLIDENDRLESKCATLEANLLQAAHSHDHFWNR